MWDNKHLGFYPSVTRCTVNHCAVLLLQQGNKRGPSLCITITAV